jgi:MFS superfamily sulfate permease-like transporter
MEASSLEHDRRASTSTLGTTWKSDLLASVVVFLVALPLCMGIAMASGMPPAAGILSGIIGGLVVGLLCGCPLQVSGPAAGLTVIVWQLVQERGVEAFAAIVLVAGVMQIAAGLLRLGQWFRAVAPAVVHGLLAGIGVLLFASQFHIMVDDVPRGTGLDNLLSIPEAVWKGLVPKHDTTHDDAARAGVLTILALLGWKALAPKRLQLLPAQLVAVMVATVAAISFDSPIQRVTMPANLFDVVTWPRFPHLTDSGAWLDLMTAAGSIAFVASAQTLLCASAVDRLAGSRTQYDRELTAQGVGNLLCGAIGGLPVAGVIARSAANAEAGGRTRLSTILHAVWLLAFAFLFPAVLRLVPTAALAALLVHTGCKLVSVKAMKELWVVGKSEVLIYVGTVLGIVCADLLAGVLLGVSLSIAKLLYTFSHLSIRLEQDAARRRAVLHLRGSATFIRLPKLARTLEAVPPKTELHVRIEELSYIDHACLDLFTNWEKQHEAQGGSLILDWDDLHARFRPLGRRKRRSRLAASRRGASRDAAARSEPGT